jgi:hypothetical protein
VAARRRELRRQPHERVERAVPARQDEDGSRRRPGRRSADHQAPVLGEDPPLEIVQLRFSASCASMRSSIAASRSSSRRTIAA